MSKIIREALPTETILNGHNNVYAITKHVGCGGNSLIYRAKYVKNSREFSAIIKEVYPSVYLNDAEFKGYVRNKKGTELIAVSNCEVATFEQLSERLQLAIMKAEQEVSIIDDIISNSSEEKNYL